MSAVRLPSDKEYLMTNVYIASHLGLGDYLICNAIFREVAAKHKKCVIATKRSYVPTVRRMLSDLPNLKVRALPADRAWDLQTTLADSYEARGYEVLRLGFFGDDFFREEEGLGFDRNFYRQAGIDFSERWSGFSVPRTPKREAALMERLAPKSEPFIFLHEDPSRGFIVNREYLTPNLPVITPVHGRGGDFFNYRGIIEAASEIHCIESSFAFFIDSLDVKAELFAHRYARPEATGDIRQVPTYLLNWNLVTN